MRHPAAGNGRSSVTAEEEDDGLMVSAAPVKVIALPMRHEPPEEGFRNECATGEAELPSSGDWLSQPLSGRTLAWTVDTLVVVAALLLFTLVFLSVTREAPKWPMAMVSGAALTMAGLYWAFFRYFAGGSLGARLARIAESEGEDREITEEPFR